MVKPLSNFKTLILTGHSGAGKDTVCAELRQHGCAVIVPHSTRAMRVDESEGNPYHFIEVNDFKNMIDTDQFIEYASYVTEFNGLQDTAYYGTTYSSIPTDCDSVVTIGVLAGVELKKRLGDHAVLVYLSVSDEVRETRARQRGSFDKIEWDNRMTQDHRRFKDGLPKEIDLLVDNGQPLEDTVQTIKTHMHLLTKGL